MLRVIDLFCNNPLSSQLELAKEQWIVRWRARWGLSYHGEVSVVVSVVRQQLSNKGDLEVKKGELK